MLIQAPFNVDLDYAAEVKTWTIEDGSFSLVASAVAALSIALAF